MKLNDLKECCPSRDDECHMIHYETRCYCDAFCNRGDTDCCPDATEGFCSKSLLATEPYTEYVPTSPEEGGIRIF